jgi:DNA-directed RNA polymerase subunit RPC12/RpoP
MGHVAQPTGPLAKQCSSCGKTTDGPLSWDGACPKCAEPMGPTPAPVSRVYRCTECGDDYERTRVGSGLCEACEDRFAGRDYENEGPRWI